MVLEFRQVALALKLKGEGNLHCSGGHNPVELSGWLCATSAIRSLCPQTSCVMGNQNTFLSLPRELHKENRQQRALALQRTEQ